MDGIIEQLHFQATLPGVWPRFCDTIEDATIAAAGNAPLQGEFKMPVLLVRDEVNGSASATVRSMPSSQTQLSAGKVAR
jgi:hypothetical protein